MRYSIRLAAVVVVGAIAGCGGGGSGGSTPAAGSNPTPSVVGMAISPVNPTVVHGDPLTLTALLVLSDGSTEPITDTSAINWSSADRFILDISPTGDGVVTTGFRGQTTVTATFQGFEASTSVTVVAVLSKIFIDSDLFAIPSPSPSGQPNPGFPYVAPAEFVIPPEFDGQLFAIAEYNDGVREDVTENATWNMADQTIATVSDDPGTKGLAAALVSGITTVSVAYSSLAAHADFNVLPTRLIGRDGAPFGGTGGLLSPMVTIDGQGKATAGWSFQLAGEVFTGGHHGTDWTERVRINANQSLPDQAVLTKVTSNTAGARLVVWFGLDGLYASYAGPDKPFTSVTTIPTNAPSFDTVDAAVVTEAGEAIVLWTDVARNLYLNRFNPATDSWSEPLALGVSLLFGRAAFNSNGDAVLAWQTEDPNSHEFTLWGAIFINGSGPDDGLQPAEQLSVAMPLATHGSDMDLALNSAGDAVVTWAGAVNQPGFPRQLYAAQRSSANGWHTKRELPMGSGSTAIGLRTAMNESGHALVAWGDPTNGLTYANRFSPLNGWDGTADQLTDAPSLATPKISAVAVAASGNAICIFVHAPTLEEPEFKFRRYVIGQSWGPLTDLPDPGVVGNPNLHMTAAYNANGEGVLAWRESGNIPKEDGGLFFVSYNFMELAPPINP